MTNLKKDIILLKNNDYNYIAHQFILKKQEIEERNHAVNVYYVFSSLEEIVGEYFSNGFHFIKVSYYKDESKNHLSFTILGENYEPAKTIKNFGTWYESTNETYEKIKDLLKIIIFDDNFIKINLKEDEQIIFPLTVKGLDDFKNMLLSDKLKASLSHALLDTQLNEKHDDTRKMKI